MILFSRSSRLALFQTEKVKSALSGKGLEVEIQTCRTMGDDDRTCSLASFGGRGAFVKTIEEALLGNQGDGAVHSLKDLPSRVPEGLALSAVLERDAAEDVLVTRQAKNLDTLPAGAVIGTSSPRRASQVLRARPDMIIKDIRGNVPTRLKKLEEQLYDGIILARAGLDRLEISPEFAVDLPFLPAPCQGIIALETRDDARIRKMAESINHRETWLCALAERSVLRTLEVGCHVPFAARASLQKGFMNISAEILSADGKEWAFFKEEGRVTTEIEAEELGEKLAAQLLLDSKAGKLLEEAVS